VRQMNDDEKEAAMKRRANPELPFTKGKKDATPAPDRVEHKGQSLTKVDRAKKKGAKGKAKSKEARA